MDQRKKRGRHLDSRRPLCGKEEESLDHLLLHYNQDSRTVEWCLLFFESIGSSRALIRDTLLG